MARKTEAILVIDAIKGVTGGGQGELVNGTTPTVSTVPTLTGPTNLEVIANQLAYSAQLPRALVTLRWVPPLGATDVRSYEIAVGTDIGITANVQRFSTDQRQAVLELTTSAAGIQYYAKVRGITSSLASDWSSVLGFISAADTTPPPNPTAITAVFNDAGDLFIEWVNPAATGYRDTEIRIYNDSGRTVLYGTYYSAAGRFYWTAAQNRLAGSGTPDPSVFVVIRGRSWAGVLASTEAFPAVQPIKALPANVTGLTTNWAADAGTAGPDLKITWNGASGATAYRLTLRGVAYRLVANTEYVYTYEQNAIDGAGTASASVSVSILAADGLGQVSAAPTALTAVNAAPAAPSGIVLTAFFATIAITVASTLPADGLAYRYRLIQTSPSAADITWDSSSPLQTRPIGVAATYQVGVKMVDVFGQAGSETLSSAVVSDTLTIADLRSDAIYSDNIPTAPATLYTQLANEALASGGVSYALNAGWVNFIRFERALAERYRTITLSMAPASGTSSWYLRTSEDGSTWSYWAGPVTGTVLTSVANAAAAQAAAISSATRGGTSTSRVDLPSTVLARYVEVWIRNTAAATTLYEYYPRRLVQSDDIQAESIKAINILAGSITADRLLVSQLSAITADMGSVTAGTITGALIRTAASGARIEMNSASGLRSFNSGGTVQVQISTTDGALTFGGGNGVLDSTGMRLTTYAGSLGVLNNANAVRWVTGAQVEGYVQTTYSSGALTRALQLAVPATGLATNNVTRISLSTTATSGADNGAVTLTSGNASFTSSFLVSATDIQLSGGLRVGTTPVPAFGEIKAFALNLQNGASDVSIDIGGGGSGNRNAFIDFVGDATYTDYGLRILRANSGANAVAQIINRGTGELQFAAQDAGSVVIYTNGSYRFGVDSAGQIGIGTTPIGVHRVTINGHSTAAATYALVVRNNSAANLFYAENNGALWANVAWTISDENEKSDITDLDQTAHELLDSLRVRRYKRTISGEYEIGFIAQEMRQTLPEAVREGMGGVLGIRTGDILALLVAARRRDMIIVRNLRQRIIALETRQP